MANIIIYDPITKKSNTVSVTLEVAVVQNDPDAVQDYFIKINTSAKKISGNSIRSRIIRQLSNLVRGTTQHDGVTSTDYASMTVAIEDYILHMIEGNGGADAMKF
jgi:hypothetical protein